MNRSAARVSAIRRFVAVGLLSAGFALPGVAPAGATPGGAAGGHSGPSRDTAQQSVGVGGGLQASRRQDRQTWPGAPLNPRERLGVATSPETGGGGSPAPQNRRFAPPTLIPEAQIVPGGIIELDPESLPVLSLAASPVGTADLVAGAVGVADAVGIVPAVVASPSAALVPIAQASGPATVAAATPGARRHPQSVGVSHLPSRVSVTAELTDTSTGELAMLALPGLAVLLGVTALGIRLGHRNARASYVLQSMGTTTSMGTTRFLQ